MPAEFCSTWHVKKPQRFAHIYFTDSYFRESALQDFDLDPRLIELEEKTFFTDPRLLQTIKVLLQQHAIYPEDTLLTQEMIRLLLAELVQRHCVTQTKTKAYRGRLSKAHLLRIDEFITEHLDQSITIDQLADLIHLSPFHLMRLFKNTMGLSLHQKVMKMRVLKASELLLQRQSQLEASIACGFANQSHLSRSFRHFFGLTPKQYQTAHQR